MFRSILAIALLSLGGACASVPPTKAPLELFVNVTSGGVWPTVVSARIYEDGTLELGDGATQRRRKISTLDTTFHQVVAILNHDAFIEEFRAAALPSLQWQSSGAWIRLERRDTIALIKPPVESPHIRRVLFDVDHMFKTTFGRQYEAFMVP